MKRLFEKFETDRLTPRELKELVDVVDGLDDQEIDLLLKSVKQDDVKDNDETKFDSQSVKNKLNGKLFAQQRKLKIYRAIGWVAVFLVLCAAGAICYYLPKGLEAEKYEMQLAREIVIKTDSAETIKTTLPDGSIIQLHPNSTLSYKLKDMFCDERSVGLDGSAYFNVKADADRRFIVESPRMTVTVLGTKFNITSRKKSDIADLFLEEGHVELITPVNNNSIDLKGGQYVFVDVSTGNIEISSVSAKGEAKALIQDFIVFKGKSLKNVLEILNSHYCVEIQLAEDKKEFENIPFTGYLKKDDLQKTLSVLCATYRLTAEQSGDAVILK